MNSQKSVNSNNTADILKSKTAKVFKENKDQSTMDQRSENGAQNSSKSSAEKSGQSPQETEIPPCKHILEANIVYEPNCKSCSEHRKNKFMAKYNEYSKHRKMKEERRNRWYKWQKPDWRKISVTNERLSFFSDSSDEDYIDFARKNSTLKSLEDSLDRVKMKKENMRVKAVERKHAGNDFMAKKDYENAVKCYTEGIEYASEIKELYTNRALAFLKLGEYQKAIQDCSRILEYTECFEGNFVQSGSICVKAFLRRAQSYKELGLYEESLQDIEQVFKLSSGDKDAQKIKDEIEAIRDAQKKSEESQASTQITGTASTTSRTLGTSPGLPVSAEMIIQKIQAFITKDKPDLDTIEFLTRVLKSSEQVRLYAYQQKIIPKFIAIFQNPPFDPSIYFLFVVFIRENWEFQREFLRLDGANHLFKLLSDLSNGIILEVSERDEVKVNKNKQNCEEIGEILEIFTCLTENAKSAEIFKSYPFITKLPQLLYKKLMGMLRYNTYTLTSFMGLLLNLTVISSDCLAQVRDHFLGQMLSDAVSYILQISTICFLRLKGNYYGLIANMLKDEKAKNRLLCSVDDFLKFLFITLDNIQSLSISNPSNLRWVNSVEGALALFINIAFNSSNEELQIVLGYRLEIFKHFKRFLGLNRDRQVFHKVILRTLQLLSKIEFHESYLVDTRSDILYSLKVHLDSKGRALGHANHALRFYIRWFDKKNGEAIKKIFKAEDFTDVITNLREIFKEEDTERRTNGFVLAGSLVELFPVLSERFKDDIKALLEIVKIKTGNEKKNAGILLARLSKNPENLRVITENNGIQVLANFKKFLLEKAT